jgi:hypothetical protein
MFSARVLLHFHICQTAAQHLLNTTDSRRIVALVCLPGTAVKMQQHSSRKTCSDTLPAHARLCTHARLRMQAWLA